jgi:DNA-directed RNA polymerase specialized sigma24 family protein
VSSFGSVTNLIDLIKSRDDVASQRLWNLFAPRLLNLARVSIASKLPLPLGDEEDVVVSALTSFFEGVEQGEYARLSDRETIWKLLTLITKRKALDLVTQDERQKRRLGYEKIPPSPNREDRRVMRWDGEAAVDPKAEPDIQVMLEEQCQSLLDALGNAKLRSIALLRMEGLTDEEIAARLGCSVRTIERKLQLIREIWSRKTS